MSQIEINSILERLATFRDERNWKKYHTIKDLLTALAIEVAELQELILWKTEHEISQIEKGRIEEELADIFIYLIYVSDYFKVDLLTATNSKISINEAKYPIEKSYDTNKKYNELNDK